VRTPERITAESIAKPPTGFPLRTLVPKVPTS
jgi:hypothetical protein